MTPEVRAIADRFMYETATLKHIVALVPDDGFERPVSGSSWSVRQLLAHLAESLHEYARVLGLWLAGEPPLEAWDPEEANAEVARAGAESSRLRIYERFGSGINGLVEVLGKIPEAPEAFAGREAVDVFRELGEHALGHAAALVDAVPEVRMDPLVLNWLLYADLPSPDGEAWQARLLAEAREYIAAHPHEDEDDE